MTTAYTFDDLKSDVRKEAEALRVHATKEELWRLEFELLNPYGRHSCIYGLMTFDCHSQRAATLIKNCTPVFFCNKKFSAIRFEGFSGVERRIKGKRVGKFIDKRMSEAIEEKHFSAIEAYILLPEAKNANLIAFLRGETNDLDL